jgi:hypothetical protein
MSQRASDATKPDSSYGFNSRPGKGVEMPPKWALLIAFGFLMVMMLFWVR